MTALVLGLAAIGVVAWLGHIVAIALRDGLKAAAARSAHARGELAEERRRAAQERHEMRVNLADEQRKWSAERTVLLNRIQDPIATAMTSNVMLVPPATSEDLSLEYEH